MGGVGSSRDVSSGGEVKGVLGLGEAFPRVGHPPHGTADGVTLTAPSIGLNLLCPRSSEGYF